jgi:hypothetical protein
LCDGFRSKFRKLNGIQRVGIGSERGASILQLGSEGWDTGQDLRECMSKFCEIYRIHGVQSAASACSPSGVHFGFKVEVRSSNGRGGGQLLCVPVARASPVMTSQCPCLSLSDRRVREVVEVASKSVSCVAFSELAEALLIIRPIDEAIRSSWRLCCCLLGFSTVVRRR